MQKTLVEKKEGDFVEIFVDHREEPSGLPELLKLRGAVVRMGQLEIGDYVLSDRCVVERKTREDFVNSLIDGRLFEQAVKLGESFDKPIIIIEGDKWPEREISGKAIDAAIAACILDFGITILFTKSSERTAHWLYILAKREQFKDSRPVRIRGGKKPTSLVTQQQYIVEGLPMIGPLMSQKLLKKFGSVESIFNASKQELQQVEGIGKEKAKKIKEILKAKFKPQD